MFEPAAPLCRLQYAASRVERCPGARCPFWVEPPEEKTGCALERAGLNLEGSPELVAALLKLRRVLDRRGRSEDGCSLFYLLQPENPPERRS